MPLTYKEDPIINGEVWFPSECATEDVDTEENVWNLRHVALFVNDWTSEAPPVHDWIGRAAGVTQQCDIFVESKYHSGRAFNHLDDPYKVVALRLRADQLRVEFEALSKKWYRDTRHLSLISKKVIHPAYLRIVGMGEAAIPLLLEALRDKPTHWFTALRATTNTDPSPNDANPSQARDAWLSWGRSQGYID